ncbi:MAG: COX15/CtaA family protein [Flavobacteriales bacterium]|jgi:cytochrome c oxidase assembly protein subunit 15|nr:COX15/CtaA family protein [Flavobacteriales bacterium]
MSKTFLSKYAFATLVSVYLVIIAGSVVRATGSGMGCPDWPKCFGYYIPPTEEEQVMWFPEKEIEEGQIIVKDQALWKSKNDFITSDVFQIDNWEKYTKHDYAIFNVAHTWTEYINRLFGAVSGLFCVLLLVFSILVKKRKLIWLSVAVLLGMVFEAWLGATVVYSMLAPHKITIHMLMALLIVWWIIVYIEQLKKERLETQKQPDSIKWVSIGYLAVSIIQILVGTQVRQAVDGLNKSEIVHPRSTWLDHLPFQLDIHILLAYGSIAMGVYLAWRYHNHWKKHSPVIIWSIAMIFLAYILGLAFRFLDFPAWAQPAHLLVSAILFGFQMLLFHRVFQKKELGRL